MPETKRYAYRWELVAPVDEVSAVLAELVDFARWWPSSWLETTEVATGASSGLGRVVSVRSRGRSPEVFEWAARCVASEATAWTWQLFGDLEGTLRVEVRAEGERTVADVVWEVVVERAELRGSLFGATVFAADLAWMMARGEEALRIELGRRVSDEGHTPPSGPRSDSTLPRTLVTVGIVAAVAGLVGLLLRRRP
ncbi:MAG: hypothetical protein U0326_35675 [Polyangiales bacterium]